MGILPYFGITINPEPPFPHTTRVLHAAASVRTPPSPKITLRFRFALYYTCRVTHV